MIADGTWDGVGRREKGGSETKNCQKMVLHCHFAGKNDTKKSCQQALSFSARKKVG
jgi:hypothetical protein